MQNKGAIITTCHRTDGCVRHTNSLFQWLHGQSRKLPENTLKEIWLKAQYLDSITSLPKRVELSEQYIKGARKRA